MDMGFNVYLFRCIPGRTSRLNPSYFLGDISFKTCDG